MKFNMDYFCGNPVIYYTCISCGYDERECYQYTASTTNTDYYLENRLSELKMEYGDVNNDDKRN
jgi:hypothetical protein